MKILVKSSAVNTRNINTRDGRAITFREQSAALDNGTDFPQPFTLSLDRDQLPYAPGEYTLDLASSLMVANEKYGSKLALGRVHLVPIAKKA